MQLVELIVGSILLLLLIIKMIQGKKYHDYVDNLDNDDYPLRSLYEIGLSWNDTKLLKLRGKIRYKLIGQAKLLYDEKYAEYYALITWSQVISFVHIGLTFGFIFAGAFNAAFFILFGILFAFFTGYYFFTRMKEIIENRKNECVVELPEIVSTMALLINSGMILREAWKKISESKDGEIYKLMQSASTNMRNGMSDADAIHRFGILSDSPDVKKFTSTLIQGLEKGNRELNLLLSKQSSEMWILKKQIMLQKGEKAASKLLIPIALIFVGILVIVISAAVGMLI